MKIDDSTANITFDQIQQSILKDIKPQIMNECLGNRKANFLCTNDKCQSMNRFTCGVLECDCEAQHTLCLRANAMAILKTIEKKNAITENFKIFIDQSITKMIDQLSDFRQQLLNLVDKQMKFISQFQVERDFIKILNGEKVNPQNFNAVNSALLWTLINSKDYETNNLFDQTKQLLNKMQLSSSKLISNFCTVLDEQNKTQMNKQETSMIKTENILKGNKQTINQLSRNQIKPLVGKSSIFKKEQYFQRVLKYFPKPVKNMTLLYKATQNNFKLNQFYQICGRIPNLMIVCQSYKDKIVGGYSPQCHYQQNLQKDVWVSDTQMQSFMFELTTDRKFYLQDRQKAMANSKNKKFICFGNNQIVIYDDAHISRECMLDCNVSYKNKKYFSTDQRIRLNGNKKSTKTSLKQWQAWKIQFQT